MTAPRQRRSSHDVRALILESARHLFATRGYADVSTREISKDAGVAESALFRHFGSKRAIYDDVMLKPLADVVQSFIDDWASQPARDVVPEVLAAKFVNGFAKTCAENGELLGVLGNRDGDGSPVTGQVTELLQRLVETLTEQVKYYHRQVDRDFVMDPKLSVRLTMALVVGLTYLGEDFIDDSDGELIAEVAAFVVRGAGLSHDGPADEERPSPTPAQRKRPRRHRSG